MQLLFIFSFFFTPINDTICVSYDYNGRTAKLLYTDNSSLFIHRKIGYDSIQVKNTVNLSSDNIAQFQSSRIDSAGSQVYRDFKNQTIIERYSTNADYIKPYVINDFWENIEWKIHKRKKKIKGYQCIKATANYRGRKYTAWFTPEIEVPYGPWKLFGLPGLIIKAYDTDKLLNFEFKSLCLKEKTPVVAPIEIVKRDLKEHVTFQDSLGYHLFAAMQKKVFNYNEKYQKQIGVMFRYTPTETATMGRH